MALTWSVLLWHSPISDRCSDVPLTSCPNKLQSWVTDISFIAVGIDKVRRTIYCSWEPNIADFADEEWTGKREYVTLRARFHVDHIIPDCSNLWSRIRCSIHCSCIQSVFTCHTIPLCKHYRHQALLAQAKLSKRWCQRTNNARHNVNSRGMHTWVRAFQQNARRFRIYQQKHAAVILSALSNNLSFIIYMSVNFIEQTIWKQYICAS